MLKKDPKVTVRDAIKKSHELVLSVGYCTLQHTLTKAGLKPIGNSFDVYGWCFDLYRLSDHLSICTGYRPTGTIDLRDLPRELIQEFKDLEKLSQERKFSGNTALETRENLISLLNKALDFQNERG